MLAVGVPYMQPLSSAPSPALLTDLYELTMADAFVRAGLHTRPATFSLFVRRLPPVRGYLVAAGLAAALDYLAALRFDTADLRYLAGTGRVSAALLDHLAGLRFTGSVRAVPEGRLVFDEEPLLEITAPLVEAQIVETAVMNILHLHTLLASKAARCVEAAAGRAVIDFGLRRAHGFDAGMAAARSAYIAGCAATSNMAAGAQYGIPISGTMAHSFIQAFPSELDAFQAYARAFPDATTLLIDTYDIAKGAENAAVVGQELAASGHRLRGVRIDSGDLLAESRRARAILDKAGLPDVQIILSGGLDETQIADLLAAGAAVDGFGLGTRMDASEDAPTLEMAYKLVEFDGRPVVKLSRGKVSWPGPKQVWRAARDGVLTGDLITTADEPPPAGHEPLLVEVMRDGRRIAPAESLDRVRARCLAERDRLPAPLRRVAITERYPVQFSAALRAMQRQVRQQMQDTRYSKA